MSDYTTTPNYGLLKPDPYADDDVWGNHLNQNADTIDGLIKTVNDSLTHYLPIAGGTLTGPLLLAADPTAALGAATKQYVDGKTTGYLPIAGGTLTGPLLLAADPTAALGAATKQYVDAKVASGTAGVASFNTRTGVVTLTLADVTNALGFTPYNATNPAGYQTAANVTASLAAYLPLAGGTVTGSTAFTSGITMGSTISAGVNLSKGIAIYSTTYGFNVTSGAMNLVAAGVAAATFTTTGINAAPIGATTPSTGAFTTLAASGAVSGAGFTTLLAPYALTSSVPVASSTLPVMNGAAAIGTGTTWARADHVHASDTTRLPLAGGSMTGSLTVTANPAITAIAPTAGISIIMQRAAGNSAVIYGNTGASNRWALTLADGTAEGGSNAGSNFNISRYTDAGVLIDTPFFINRATGNALFSTSGISLSAPAGAYATLTLNKTTQSGQGVQILGTSANLSRWSMYLGDSTTESAGAGSNFSLNRFNDAGTFVDQPMIVYRGTGQLAVTNDTPAKITAGGWVAISDARTKTVIGPYVHGLAEIVQLGPVRFTFKGNTEAHRSVASDAEFAGLIAQDVEGVLPEMVSLQAGEIDGEPVDDLRSLDPGPLQWAMVNAFKELAQRVAALEGVAP